MPQNLPEIFPVIMIPQREVNGQSLLAQRTEQAQHRSVIMPCALIQCQIAVDEHGARPLRPG